MIIWTKEQARHYLVSYQMINTVKSPTIQEIFDRVKSIQYDPLNIVGTNPELVLQARIPAFQKTSLQQALYDERSLIDGWDKQMCIYQTKDFNLLKRLRTQRAQQSMKAYKKYFDIDVLSYQDELLNVLRQEGPIFAKDLDIGQSISTGFGTTKISTATIDYLFHLGLIGIAKRKNTQKKYDLMERLAPQLCETVESFHTQEDFLDYYLERRIRMKGLVWNKSSNLFSDVFLRSKTVRTKHFRRLLEQGKLEQVQIETLSEPFYIPKDASTKTFEVTDRMSFIAPLDNLIWDRDLIKMLFNFDYKWEVYTPSKKRIYGYYVLPILKGASFIGRIEFENHKTGESLRIKNLWFENNVKRTKALDSSLEKALHVFSIYQNAEGMDNLSDFMG